MPELPDVEVKKRYLEETSLDRKVSRVRVTDSRVLGGGTTPESLDRALKGRSFQRAARRGKYLLVDVERAGTLLMHFGMTGDLVSISRGDEVPRFEKVSYDFSGGGALCFTDIRMFGKVAYFETRDLEEIPDVAKLGPEPLSRSFTLKKFSSLLDDRSTSVHQVLMDQHLIAGIGNEYSDEIAFQAGIRPDRKVSSLSPAEVEQLFDRMKWTLRRGIALGADLDRKPDEFLHPHRVKDGTCPTSGTRLVRKTLGGRSSYYCPDCQS